MVLKYLIFNSFYIGHDVVVFKELIFNVCFTVSTLGGCDGSDRTDFFNTLYCWEGVVVLKELIFNSFYVRRVWWS